MVNTVFKAMQILEELAGSPNQGISEIARTLELPKSSAHGILETLAMEGFVERNAGTGKYHLGTKLVELGYRAQLELDICQLAKPFLQGLNEEFDETTHLTVLDHDEVLYVDCVESRRRLRTYSVIGIRAPLYCTSVGKAILAFQPDKEILRIAREKGLARITANTIDNEERLMAEVARIRRDGFAVDDMEHEEHLRCVGAPIYNAKGEVFASLSLSGPAERNTPERIEGMVPSVLRAAAEVSRRLGYRK
ncbi:MAG: IclR family transcriptional regulator [Spirochaetia bacterium]|jgi:DNA-binding IclR family transcriptional regulator|nr:IclR family transcriptional regulator [Spirochaetia bacterium]